MVDVTNNQWWWHVGGEGDRTSKCDAACPGCKVESLQVEVKQLREENQSLRRQQEIDSALLNAWEAEDE